MISRMAVGETPSPSLDCLNFLMAMGFERFALIFAKKTNPYVPSPIFPITSYCSSHSGLLLLVLVELLPLPSPIVPPINCIDFCNKHCFVLLFCLQYLALVYNNYASAVSESMGNSCNSEAPRQLFNYFSSFCLPNRAAMKCIEEDDDM